MATLVARHYEWNAAEVAQAAAALVGMRRGRAVKAAGGGACTASPPPPPPPPPRSRPHNLQEPPPALQLAAIHAIAAVWSSGEIAHRYAAECRE